MRKLKAFIILVALCISLASWAQLTSSLAVNAGTKYQKISEFKSDTLKYLNENFIDNKSNYVGKEFNVLLVDLEFEIKKCTASISANNRYIIPGINISFDTPTNIYLKGKSGTKTYHLQIDWEQPMQSDAVWKFMKETNYDGWSDLHKKFFGNQIIKDIRVIVL